jgi:hypothetical protein
MHHFPSLNVLVLSATQDATNHDEDRELLQIRTAIVLNAHTGDRGAIHTIDSDTQGSYIVDCFVLPDWGNPVLGLAWQNGNGLTVGLDGFIVDGFEREDEGKRACMLVLFPAELITASIGHKEIVAVARVKKHPVISEGGREDDIPDWEEEGKVMFARW